MISTSSSEVPIVLRGACGRWKLDEFYSQFDSRHDNKKNSKSYGGSDGEGLQSSTSAFADVIVPWRAIPLQRPHSNRIGGSGSDKNLDKVKLCSTKDRFRTYAEKDCKIIHESFGNFFRWQRQLTLSQSQDSSEALQTKDASDLGLKDNQFHRFYCDCDDEDGDDYGDCDYADNAANKTTIATTENAKFAFYADYLHFPVVFDSIPDHPALEFGDWDEIVGRGVAVKENLTMWLGCNQAYTPLHYDSYSVNCVCQVKGCKRWRLWAPDAKIITKRIPYEESSIYADVDYHNDESNKSPLPTPFLDVVLEEGDFLFVPKHWWHLVETTSDVALSVNMWIPHRADIDDRLSEAIARLVAMSLVSASASTSSFAVSGMDDVSRSAGSSSSFGTGGSTRDDGERLVNEGWLCRSEAIDDGENESNGLGGLDNHQFITGVEEHHEGKSFIDHGENVSFLLETLKEMSPSTSSAVSATEILQCIVNELLQPDIVARCSAKVKQLISKTEK